jgi:hypothetical protein
MIFGICAGVFAPSSQLRLALLNHLITVIENESQEITARASYCLNRLEQIYENGRRLVAPLKDEIKYMKHMKPYPIKIYFLSGSYIYVLVESYDNVSDLRRKLLRKLKISVPKFGYYGFYEIYDENVFEERYIEDNELVMDLISNYSDSLHFKIVLKLRIFHMPLIKDPTTASFMYIQTAFDVITNRIPLDLNTAITLGAIKLLVDYGRDPPESDIDLYLYLPPSLYYQFPINEWLDKLLHKHSIFKELPRPKAQRLYVEQLKNHALLGSSFFYITVSSI